MQQIQHLIFKNNFLIPCFYNKEEETLVKILKLSLHFHAPPSKEFNETLNKNNFTWDGVPSFLSVSLIFKKRITWISC